MYVYGTDTAIKPYVLAKHKNVARQVEPTTVSSFLPARACVDRTPKKETQKKRSSRHENKIEAPEKNKFVERLASIAKPSLRTATATLGADSWAQKAWGYKTKSAGNTAVRGYTRPNAMRRRNLPQKRKQETRAGGKISHEGKYSPWNGGCKGGRSLTDVTGRTPEARTWQ